MGAPGRCYAFLRAINTGGRRLTNDELLRPFRELGFTDVAAYQAAGNVTFVADDPAAVSPEGLDDVLSAAFGFECPSFVRTAAELSAIVDAEPFTAGQLAATAGRVQVTFLRDEPDAGAVADVLDLVPAEDLVVVTGREWYWLPVDGVSGSGLRVGEVERCLGPMTMRTLGTLRRFVAKYDP